MHAAKHVSKQPFPADYAINKGFCSLPAVFSEGNFCINTIEITDIAECIISSGKT